MSERIKVTDQTLHLAKTGWPCKIGTIPNIVRLHASDIIKLAPGNSVRIKEGYPTFAGLGWTRVLVQSVDCVTLHFQADR